MVTHARIPFSDLVFLDDNPRTRTPDGLRRMADDIQADPTFFDNRPVLVNLTAGRYQVYAGDLRAHAAHDVLGWPDIPCNVEPDVPDATMRRRAIQDNTHREGWDAQVLQDSWGDVDLQGLGLDAGAWGGDADEQPAHIATEDDYEPPAEIQTDIVPGDIITIGPHRLLCGDSTDIDAVARLMDKKKIELVVTDPPYGVSYVGKTDDAMTIENDSMSETETFELWRGSISALWPFWKEGGALYATVPAGPLHIGFVQELKNLDVLRQSLVWNKSSMVLGHSDYHYKHEPVLYGWKPGAAHYFTDDRTQTTVLDVEKPAANREHPTMKPIKLWEIFIVNSSKENWTIYDPFLGSGTTMVAAHQLHRRCFGIEIDPKYCQVIVDRMQKLDPSLPITINGKPYTGV